MEVFNKTKVRFIASLLFNIAILFVFLCLFDCDWRTNDDVFIKLIVSGAYGSPDYHTIFNSGILGRIYSFLYSIKYDIPWYELINYICCFLSLLVITNIFLERNNNLSICAVTIIAIAYQTYVRPQFSITAALLIVSGVISLVHYFNENCNILYFVSGLFLSTLSIWFRKNQFLACFLICFILVLSTVISVIKTKDVEKIKKLVVAFVFMSIIFGITVIVDKIDYSSMEWTNFQKYNSLRSQLIDNGYPEYEENTEVYQKLNINENAYNLYTSWNFDDSEKFKIEDMEKLLESKKAKPISLELLISFLISLINYSVFDNEILIFFLLIFAVFIIYILGNYKSWKSLTKLLLISLSVLFCMFYVYYKRECFLNRLTIGYYFVLLLLVLYSSAKTDRRLINAISIGLFVIFIMTSLDTLKINSKSEIEFRQKMKTATNLFNDDYTHLYISKVSSYVNEYDILFDTEIMHNNANITSLGECDTSSPLKNSILNKYGINNLYEDIIDNSNVYLVDDNIDMTIEYINDYYDTNAYYMLVEEVNGLRVYKILSN